MAQARIIGRPDVRTDGREKSGVSQHAETCCVQAALQAGARGYVTKQEAAEVIITAIRAVLKGQIYLSPSLSFAGNEGNRVGLPDPFSIRLAGTARSAVR